MRGLMLLSLVATVTVGKAVAEDVAGAPKEIEGRWGANRAQCRSYHRKSDGITIIDRETMTNCGGSACGLGILSHKKIGDRYEVRLRGNSGPPFTETFRLLGDEALEETSTFGGKTSTTTLARCTERDAIAGIAMPDREPGMTRAPDLMFAGFYALAVPDACLKQTVDTKAANGVVEVGRLAWIDFLIKHRIKPTAEAAAADARITVQLQQEKARSAVRQDAQEIHDFCDKVLDALGPEGMVVKGLLVDGRKRA